MLYTQSFGSQAGLFLFKQTHCQHSTFYIRAFYPQTPQSDLPKKNKQKTKPKKTQKTLCLPEDVPPCGVKSTALMLRNLLHSSLTQEGKNCISTEPLQGGFICSGICLGYSSSCCCSSLQEQCISLQTHGEV